MIEIEEMRASEARQVLGQLNYTHLALAENNIPSVVPVHCAFDGHDIFVYTTEGKKADIIKVTQRSACRLRTSRITRTGKA